MPEDESSDPELLDVINKAVRAGRAGMHTCIPAVVTSYNAVKQTITAQITVRDIKPNDEGEQIDSLPTPIPNVPVAFPSGNGVSMVWPLAAGDHVLLVFAERSIGEWKTTGQSDNKPMEPRRFNLSDAFAIPGVRPPSNPLPAASYGSGLIINSNTTITLGDSSAARHVAVAEAVLNELENISTFMAAHVHNAFGIPTSPPTGPAYAPGSVGSTVVKVN